MDANELSKEKMEQLIKMASQKTGTDESAVRAVAQSGDLDRMLKNLKPQQAAKLQEVLQNKDMAEKMLSSPQAKMLLSKFIKGK